MLRQIGIDRNYKSGWAAVQFKERFGHWPDGFLKVNEEPNEQVLRWVRSRMIRYAKGRAAHAPA
jgi:DNA repair protein RadD